MEDRAVGDPVRWEPVGRWTQFALRSGKASPKTVVDNTVTPEQGLIANPEYFG